MDAPLSSLSTAATLPDERRHHERLALLRPVQYCLGTKLLIGELIDIADDGMRLRVTRPVGVGRAMTVYLSLPATTGHDSRTCVLDARVVWEKGSVAGLAFAEGPSTTRDCVSLLLSRQLNAADG